MTPLESIEKLTKDLKMAAEVLPVAEARFLVDAYYQMQDARIRSAGQIRSIIQDKHSEAREPHELLTWFFEQNRILENQIRSALDKYTGAHVMGDWMRSIKGIGPVISAGMLAHIDIEKAPTVGHIWSFAGLVDGVEWTKGQKRPWNAQLKTLCWKAGESFVKVSGRDDAFYGRIYAERKKQEMARNEAGDFAGQARAKLEKFKIGKNTDAYAAYSIGKLPPGHIHARAKRYTVKLFLSHLHHVWYEIHFGIAPPNPYPIAHMGHAHMIPPPMKP
jgi:hypothetical protein